MILNYMVKGFRSAPVWDRFEYVLQITIGKNIFSRFYIEGSTTMPASYIKSMGEDWRSQEFLDILAFVAHSLHPDELATKLDQCQKKLKQIEKNIHNYRKMVKKNPAQPSEF